MVRVRHRSTTVIESTTRMYNKMHYYPFYHQIKSSAVAHWISLWNIGACHPLDLDIALHQSMLSTTQAFRRGLLAGHFKNRSIFWNQNSASYLHVDIISLLTNVKRATWRNESNYWSEQEYISCLASIRKFGLLSILLHSLRYVLGAGCFGRKLTQSRSISWVLMTPIEATPNNAKCYTVPEKDRAQKRYFERWGGHCFPGTGIGSQATEDHDLFMHSVNCVSDRLAVFCWSDLRTDGCDAVPLSHFDYHQQWKCYSQYTTFNLDQIFKTQLLCPMDDSDT